MPGSLAARFQIGKVDSLAEEGKERRFFESDVKILRGRSGAAEALGVGRGD